MEVAKPTICKHPAFGIIRGLTMKYITRRDEVAIRLMLAGITCRKIEASK